MRLPALIGWTSECIKLCEVKPDCNFFKCSADYSLNEYGFCMYINAVSLLLHCYVIVDCMVDSSVCCWPEYRMLSVIDNVNVILLHWDALLLSIEWRTHMSCHSWVRFPCSLPPGQISSRFPCSFLFLMYWKLLLQIDEWWLVSSSCGAKRKPGSGSAAPSSNEVIVRSDGEQMTKNKKIKSQKTWEFNMENPLMRRGKKPQAPTSKSSLYRGECL